MLDLDLHVVDLPLGLLRAVELAPGPQVRGRRGGDDLSTQKKSALDLDLTIAHASVRGPLTRMLE